MKRRGKRMLAGARLVGLPEEVLFDVPRLVLLGEERVVIENHRGIVEYGETRVRVRTDCGLMEIVGSGLRLEYFGQNDVVVLGKVDGLGYHLPRQP